MAEPVSLPQLTEALSAPLGDLIAAVGRGVAEAQQALDQHTYDTFRAIYGSDEQAYEEFRALGYRPSFYILPETTAEILVSLTVGGSSLAQGSQGPGGGVRLYAAPLDASYRNRFDYDLRAASKVSFKIVPVPPSPQAEAIRVVPPVVGRPLGEALGALTPLGVQVTLVDQRTNQRLDGVPPLNWRVAAAQPPQGSILAAGQGITLTVRSESCPHGRPQRGTDRTGGRRMSDTAPLPLVYLPLVQFEGTAPDRSGHGRNGTLQGNAQAIADDVFGYCLNVADGAFVSVPEDAGRALHLGNVLTVEAWALVTARRPGHCRIVGKGEGNGRNYVLWLIDGTGWMFQWNHYSGGFIVTRPTIRLNTWYHLAAVVRDGTSTLYVHGRDGRLITTVTGTHSGTTGDTTEPLTVGTGFAGRIAHVRVYAQALGQEDIERDIAGDLAAGRMARVLSLLSLARPQAGFRFGASGTTIAAAETALPIIRPRLYDGFTLEAIWKPYAVELPGLIRGA